MVFQLWREWSLSQATSMYFLCTIIHFYNVSSNKSLHTAVPSLPPSIVFILLFYILFLDTTTDQR